MEALIISLLIKYSVLNEIDPVLAMAVVQVESAYKPNAVGPVGEIGLMQIRPEYFPQYSKNQLFDIETNIRLGTAHLAKQIKSCTHRGMSAVVCYNLGVRGAKRIVDPKGQTYYKKVKKAYTTIGSIDGSARLMVGKR